MGEQQEKKIQIMMKDMTRGTYHQLPDELTFGEAFGMVMFFRSLKDGNRYWIGKRVNHIRKGDI